LSDAATQLSGQPAPGGTPGATPAPGGDTVNNYAWPQDLAAPVVDLLKSKGVYDDPKIGIPKLANSYFEANKALSGGDVIIAPGDWANEEGVEKFRTKTRGVAKFEEYDPKFADGFETNPNFVEFSKKLAWEWGVPKALFQKGITLWQDFARGQIANEAARMQTENNAAIEALKTKQGPEVYSANMAAGQNVVKSLKASGRISQATLEAVEKHIGSAALIELITGVGAGMKESGTIGNGGHPAPTDPSQMTAEQANAEINRLNGDKEFQDRYLSDKHPEHAVAVERMKNLFAAAARKAA